VSRPAVQGLVTGGLAIALVAVGIAVSSAHEAPTVNAPTARSVVTGLDLTADAVAGAYPGSAPADCAGAAAIPGSFSSAWAGATGSANGCPAP